MVIIVLSLILSITFFVLSLVHFNWVIGGTFGLHESLPVKENGEKLFTPRKFDSALVGLGLLTLAYFYLFTSGLITPNFPKGIVKFAGWIIPCIFFLRAIGEFRYIGFFKKVKNTKFGNMDTKFFSPLCLAIALAGFLIQIL